MCILRQLRSGHKRPVELVKGPERARESAQWTDLLMLWYPPAFLLQVAGRWAEGVLTEFQVEIHRDVVAHQRDAFLIESGIASILGREIGD